jgi:hypothetical protein
VIQQCCTRICAIKWFVAARDTSTKNFSRQQNYRAGNSVFTRMIDLEKVSAENFFCTCNAHGAMLGANFAAVVATAQIGGVRHSQEKSVLDFRDRSRIMNGMARKKKNPYAVALGRRGGLKGGPARASNMTPEERSESARNAVMARWAKAKERTNSTARQKG